MAIVGYWRLNGNSNDASGNGNNGSDTNITYSQSNGKLGQGAGFNSATNSKISLTYINLTSGTISLWVYSSDTSSSPDFIATNKWESGSYNYFQIGIVAGVDNAVWCYTPTDGNIKYTRTGKDNFDLNKWNFYVFTQSGTSIIIYKNCIQQDVTTVGTQNEWLGNANRNKMTLGMLDRYTSEQYSKFTGYMDEVIIDNSIWTPAQVKNKYSYYKGFF